jgi:hypothetical protein
MEIKVPSVLLLQCSEYLPAIQNQTYSRLLVSGMSHMGQNEVITVDAPN